MYWLEIEHALQILGPHVQQQADAAGRRFQEPDMRDRRGQLDMAHALPAHRRLDDLDPALFAHDALNFMRLSLPHRHS